MPSLTAATANVDKALRGKKMRQAIRKPANRADVIAYQEVERKRHVKAVRALPGFDAYLPAGLKRSWKNACPIAWRRDRFTLARSGWVRIGHGIRFVQPNRVAAWVLLDDHQTDQVIAVVSAHTVSGTWQPKKQRRHYRKWSGRNRIAESDHELAQVAELARRLAERAATVIVCGDFNRAGRIPASKVGCEHIAYASQPTHGKHWFDLIGLTGATPEKVRRVHTPSDHDALVARIRTEGERRA